MLALAKYGSGKGIGKYWMGGIIALELVVVAIKPLKRFSGPHSLGKKYKTKFN